MRLWSNCLQFSRLHILGLLFIYLCGLIPSSQQQIPHALRYHLKDARTAEEFKHIIMLYSTGQNIENDSDNLFVEENIIVQPTDVDYKVTKNKPKMKTQLDVSKTKSLGGIRRRSTRQSPPVNTNKIKGLAKFPECTPRATVVDIPKGNDPNIIFWPPCVMLDKCSGCCPSDLTECTAVKTEPVVVKVIQHVLSFDEGVEVELEHNVTMEKDVECLCQCKVQKEHCNPSIHRYTQCSCQCIMGKQPCPATMEWDTETCSCVCNATPQQRICSRKRQVFDEELCQCDCKKHARERCQPPRVFNEAKCKCEEVLYQKTTASMQVQVNKCVPVECPLAVSFNLQSCQCEEVPETEKYTTRHQP